VRPPAPVEAPCVRSTAPRVPHCPQACRARAGVKLVNGGGNLVAAGALVGRSVTGRKRPPHRYSAGYRARAAMRTLHTLVHIGARSYERGRGRVPAATEPVHGTDAGASGGVASSCRELGVHSESSLHAKHSERAIVHGRGLRCAIRRCGGPEPQPKTLYEFVDQ
jgi:hypothetical protein